MKNNKGFTLIELLVVIAVLGILAAVVLVAINPTARMNEARDAGKKNDVGQVALAVETCYTSNEGSYVVVAGTAADTDCSDTSALETDGFLKRAPTSVTCCDSGTEVYCEAALDAPSGTNTHWVYYTATGVSGENTSQCP